MMTVKDFTLAVVAAAGLSASLLAQSASLDYTQWRGPNRDGSAAAFAEPKAWPDTLTRQWKVDVGLGYATPLVVANRIHGRHRLVFTLPRKRDDDGRGCGKWK